MNNSTLILENISKSYKQATGDLVVLDSIDMNIKQGEIVSLIGQSGSGKTTMLQISGLLDQPTTGSIIIGGKDCSKLGDTQRTELRRDYIGFVYQYHNLLSDFTAVENVVLPQIIGGANYKLATEKAKWLLEKMGMEHRFLHRPGEMSGGEMQRVAIARALANTPKLLLADEPTGNLDPKTADIVFEALLAIVRETGLSALIATHNFELAGRMDRKLKIEYGKLVEL